MQGILASRPAGEFLVKIDRIWKLKSLRFLPIFGYMQEPNREIWRYFPKKKKTAEFWRLETPRQKSLLLANSSNLARKKMAVS
jgi:hypothetical protein